jgi:hypothetical protein
VKKPLSQRKRDVLILAFFAVNLVFVTYIIADPYHFDYPVWPLPFVVDLIYQWGSNFDPVLMARSMWWRMTIWINPIFFGSLYVAAIYAYIVSTSARSASCRIARAWPLYGR